MAVCPHCQIQLNPGTTACPECGTRVPQNQQSTQQATHHQNYQQNYQQNNQQQRSQQQPPRQQPQQGYQQQQFQQAGLGPQEQYCPGCGQIVHNRTPACPNCGYQLQDDFNAGLWIAGGVVSFVVGLIVLAIVFGPLTVFIGYKVYAERGGVAGPLIMLGGALDVVLWLLFVMMLVSAPTYYPFAGLPLA